MVNLLCLVLVGSLTLEEAETIALSQNPDLAAAKAALDAAASDQDAQRGLFLPKLHADGSVTYYGEPYSLSLLSRLPPALIKLIPPGSSSAIAIHNAWTGQLTLSANQPISQLWGLSRGLVAARRGHEAAEAGRDAALREVIYQVRRAYFRLLSALGNRDIAQDSVKQLASHVAIAKEQRAAGTLVTADLLRAQVQEGQARQDLIRAGAAVRQAEAELNRLLGGHAGQALVPADPFATAPLPELHADLGQLTSAMLATRPDLEQAQRQEEQAEAQALLAWAQLLPAVSILGEYQHTSGQFGYPLDQGFVGGILSWDFWDWGNKFYAAEAARARGAQSKQTVRSMLLRLSAEIESAFENFAAERDALGLSKEIVEQAEEGFRLETERYKAHAATATDLLDAQSTLSQAKQRLLLARYDYLTTLAELEYLAGKALLQRPG